MPDPLTLLGIGTSAFGALGSIFGSGQQTDLPPELQKLFSILEQRGEEGLSEEERRRLAAGLTARLGNEFGGLSALTNQQLQRSGAGVGVQQAAREKLSGQRFQAVGAGLSNIEGINQQVKSSALGQLTQLSGLLPAFTSDPGAAYGELLGAGFDLLSMSRQQKQSKDLLKGLQRGNQDQMFFQLDSDPNAIYG